MQLHPAKLLCAISFFFASLSGFAQPAGKVVYQELEPAAFRQTYQKTPGAVLLDVRTAEEYGEGHLAQARNVDYKRDDFRQQVARLDKSKTYFVYCKGGVRSEKAADIMKELGFRRVYTLEGGIDEWEDEDLPVEKKQ
ncbi:MAG: rhodanese-like domain-containing protein [Cytophagales bacterium]|nr:rhodanese-like domain-containing protein [Cytophagales bacterium]